MYYRRNADEDIRSLERKLYAGDESVLPQLVAAMLRMGGPSLPFLIQFPQAIQYLPEKMRAWISTLSSRLPHPKVVDISGEEVEECLNCGAVDVEFLTCENIIDAEGNVCGADVCELCVHACPECDMDLCEDCAGPHVHRCPESAEECSNCGKDLYMQDQDDSWVFISAEAAEYLDERGAGGAEPGRIFCEDCLEEYDIDNIADATEGGQLPETDPEDYL